MEESLDRIYRIDQQGVGCQVELSGRSCDSPAVSGYTAGGVLASLKNSRASQQQSRRGGVAGLTSSEAKSSYLDYIANPLTNVKRCPGWFVLGLCESGHHWAKEIYCGREWCENCREATHDRRFSRLLPKARQLSSTG